MAMMGLDGAVAQLLTNPKDISKVALQTLISIAENIIHKKEEKFRRLKKSNGAVQRKVTDVPGGVACLVALGFTEGSHEGEPAWCAPADRDGFDRLVDGKARLALELDRLYDTPVDTDRPPQGPGGIAGMLQQALQDPSSLRRLLQNPMVSQMIRGNPQLVESALQSPAAQAMLSANPDLQQQVEGLLGHPLVQPAPPPVAGPAARFETQLAQLREMGFYDQAACLAALEGSGGNVELALAALVP
mmetsp:Transcript_81578/g.174826  ORF Transcript_81578/g.174826 Transcript_81578/m.174826 type:complete len:245 (-) Transcript_81578:73-807(-)